jgi:peptidyl-prolyl cis-trans isomerase SurA
VQVVDRRKVTLDVRQLRERLRQDGINYNKFRDNIRDQLLVERVREREVTNRIKISEADIDELVAKRLKAAGGGTELDIAQILVSVPEDATPAVVAERRARAEAAQRRVLAGEDFATVAREVSEDSNRAQGGDIGMRPADRLPDSFVRVAERLKPGEIAPELVKSGSGFHVLKLVDRKESGALTVDQSRVRHILLRPSAELTPEAAARRLLEFKREILAGTKTFEQLARANSEDASALRGGDLGWTSPGSFVPEFEQAVDALPVGGISDPVTTRFGLHLVQVVDRRKVTLDVRQLREQARNILREQKFEQAFAEWLRDLRSRSYIELRDPPQS